MLPLCAARNLVVLSEQPMETALCIMPTHYHTITHTHMRHAACRINKRNSSLKINEWTHAFIKNN